MQVWTTLDRPPAEQYPYWREVLCEAFTALDPVAKSVSTFESTVARKHLLGVTVSEVTSRAQNVVRGVHEIRRTSNEYFFANMQLGGSCIVRQDGREVLIRPGDFYIVDTTRVYELDFEDWRLLCIRIPRHLLVPLLQSPRNSTAVRLHDDGALGTIAGSFMRTVLQCPEDIASVAQQTLINTLVNLIAIALGGTAEAREHGRASIQKGMRDAIIRHVESDLANPMLSTPSVAAHFRISTRYLQRLFEGHDRTFAQMIIEKRLDRCAHDLLESKCGSRSISEIIYASGFNDVSNFCRMFRRRFGMSPSDYRHSRGTPGSRTAL
ncbi:MAG: helix-turn-helix domain-containing protein [Nevskia sp.]|nr:helix-turn-helix domain-containing protein [Nevskia sp.]